MQNGNKTYCGVHMFAQFEDQNISILLPIDNNGLSAFSVKEESTLLALITCLLFITFA